MLDDIRGRVTNPPARWDTDDHTQATEDREALLTMLDEMTADRDELQATFDAAWGAQLVAIKRWQRAHPGRDAQWPDSGVLVEWLLSVAFPGPPCDARVTTTEGDMECVLDPGHGGDGHMSPDGNRWRLV